MKQTAYERVTERVIELMEKGSCPWRRPWSRIPAPQNFSSGKTYRGINLLLLGSMGYESPYYLTFKQAMERGGGVRKGEKGTQVYYWGTFEPKDRTAEQEETKQKFFLKHYTVFNASQIDGIDFPTPEKPEGNPIEPIAEAQKLVAQWQSGPKIRHGMRDATYSPLLDVIGMPHLETFLNAPEYYSTLFHEMGHATGHRKRLDRKMEGGFGSESYSKEELIAEMTSAFLCAQCGIDNEVIENQAAYLRGWMKALKSDARLVVTAASQARKAADLILGEKESSEVTAAKADAHSNQLHADALARQR